MLTLSTSSADFRLINKKLFMPELPEVEAFRRYIEKTSLNLTIADVVVKNEKILQEISVNDLIDNLISRKFIKTSRLGKHLFIQIDNQFWVTIHFGMSGSLLFFHDLNNEPRHCRLLIKFHGDNYLCFDDQRLLGRIGLTDNINSFSAKHQLGKDALDLEEDEFIRILFPKKKAIKTVLMQQELIAGIGNEYSDEILFQARIDPSVQPFMLSIEQLRSLYREMRSILKTAIESRIKPGPFPDYFFLHSARKKKICPRCGSQVVCKKFSGRTGCFCPSCQTGRSNSTSL